MNSKSLDFTLGKYEELCCALLKSGYVPQNITNYLRDDFADGLGDGQKTVILRHDIDRKLMNALRMAKLEYALGIRSTYYFRYPHTFRPEAIRAIYDLGHEVGYHYETLSKARGDHVKAIRLFEQELSNFREIPGCNITTICMHGSPLSRYDNRDLWLKYDFRDYGIFGEAYLSMAEKDVQYFTDTGRNWGGKHSLRDMMPNQKTYESSIKTTNDLVAWIESSVGECLYLTVHPERWAQDEREWMVCCFKDFAVNFGKNILTMVR